MLTEAFPPAGKRGCVCDGASKRVNWQPLKPEGATKGTAMKVWMLGGLGVAAACAMGAGLDEVEEGGEYAGQPGKGYPSCSPPLVSAISGQSLRCCTTWSIPARGLPCRFIDQVQQRPKIRKVLNRHIRATLL